MTKEIQLAILRACGRYIRKQLAPMQERIAGLEAIEKRLEAIEQRGIAYRGVWQAADQYNRGELVTFGGSLWHANTFTRKKPGDGMDWTLAVKQGEAK